MGAWLLAGKPKDGKTWLAMNLACAVLTGQEYVGCRPEDGQPGLVVYMSLDDDSQARFVRRLGWMNVTKAQAKALLVATAVDGDHYESAFDMTRALLTTYPGVRFLVIDTLGSFRSRDRKDGVYQQEYDEVKAINGLAHEYGVCILIVHHFRKGAVDPATPFESISGTLGLQGGVDGMLVMTRKDYSHPTDSALDERLAALWYRGRDVDEGDVGVGARGELALAPAQPVDPRRVGAQQRRRRRDRPAIVMRRDRHADRGQDRQRQWRTATPLAAHASIGHYMPPPSWAAMSGIMLVFM